MRGGGLLKLGFTKIPVFYREGHQNHLQETGLQKCEHGQKSR